MICQDITFQEWDPSVGTDDTSTPMVMLVNSSELRAADFPLAEVRSLHLDAVAYDRTGDEMVALDLESG